jgi:hypothetical protein
MRVIAEEQSFFAGSNGLLNDVYFIDSEIGWIVGGEDNNFYPGNGYGIALFTSDGGENWETINVGTDLALYSAFFTDQNNGWLVGTNGTILHTDNGGITQVSENHPPVSEKTFYLQFKIFPNPFSYQTSIKFSLSESNQVTLSIFDIAGKRIDTIISEKLPEGEHNIIWNATGIKGGIYFIRLETQYETQINKALLIN